MRKLQTRDSEPPGLDFLNGKVGRGGDSFLCVTMRVIVMGVMFDVRCSMFDVRDDGVIVRADEQLFVIAAIAMAIYISYHGAIAVWMFCGGSEEYG